MGSLTMSLSATVYGSNESAELVISEAVAKPGVESARRGGVLYQ